ncbi:MAG: type II secretion system secretin GspD [Desulfobacteraceae bacterium]|nr:type II secretion system secretin GspD [Desulfobacteraceae bacterium]
MLPRMAIRLLLAGLCLAVFLSPLTAIAADQTPPAGDERFVSIDFNNVDIAVFIKFISELTGRNFIVDERVRGKVTVISPSRISVAEAFKVFESVLEVHGFTTVPSGTVTKVVPAPEARAKSIETRLYEEAGGVSDRVVTQIVTLKYADPEEARKLLAPLVSKNSVLLAYPPTGMMILTDVYSNIQRLMRIISAIDVTGVGHEIAVIRLEYAEALKLEKIVATVFNPPTARAQKGPAAIADTVQVVSDERTNSLIVLAKESDIARVRDLVALLDRQTPRGQGKIRVYYLENAVAEDLAKVLKDVPIKEDQKPAAGAAAEAPALSGEIQITADQATNSLIIIAAKEDYDVIEEIIAKLDIPRSMVYIECLIMEVNVNKDFTLGVKWSAFGKTDIDGKAGAFGGAFGAPDPVSFTKLDAAGAFGIFGEAITVGGQTFPSLGAIIDAYKHDKDVHILSTPQILTTDNQEAKIYIGKNVPFQTRQETTATTSIDYSSYEYKDVGTTLEITPRINQERLVRLDISQEVTKLESNVNLDYRPTTLKRTIDTSVIVQDGQTVVIGGLIDESTSLTENKVPVLGDIPLLGWLFKTRGRGNEKTNLFVFITPRVIRNPGEADLVYSDKKEFIDRMEADSPLRKGAPGDPEASSAVELPPAASDRIRLYPGPEQETIPAKPIE